MFRHRLRGCGLVFPAFLPPIFARLKIVVEYQDADLFEFVEGLAGKNVVDIQIAVLDHEPFSRQTGNTLDEYFSEQPEHNDLPAPGPAKAKDILVDQDLIAACFGNAAHGQGSVAAVETACVPVAISPSGSVLVVRMP